MRSSRIFYIVLPVSLFLILSSTFPRLIQNSLAYSSKDSESLSLQYSEKLQTLHSNIFSYHSGEDDITASTVNTKKLSNDSQSGIKEDIPAKYREKFQKWKKEFLSTEIGKEQWSKYEHNQTFTLTITVSKENSHGASTGNYKWDDNGKLIAATISLGSNLNKGFPNPIYYPVMSSLMLPEQSNDIDGDFLAATKLAHEFGHLNYTAKADSGLYQLQGQLMPQYNKIFLSNGRKVNDPRLLELAQKMGGTPVEIWENREYWGEANAMLYINGKLTNENLRCSLFNRIKQSVNLYAKNYEDRFLQIAHSTQNQNMCGW